jgi:hypothetical protein
MIETMTQEFVLYTPQDDCGKQMQVIVWRYRGRMFWMDSTRMPRDKITANVMKVAEMQARDIAGKLGRPMTVNPVLLSEGCPTCREGERACRECMRTEGDQEDWAHLPGWWERVDLVELQEEVLLARKEGVISGQAPGILWDPSEDM